MNLIQELKWRGMYHDATPGIEDALKSPIVAYAGFDPTASSLHIGNLAVIMLLVHAQRAGHTPVALVGGATGMVGDPSGKSAERNLLDENVLRHNEECIKKQLAHFLDFSSKENAAIMVNNYDWFKEFSFLEFLRNVGKHLTVSYMLSKDSVKNRMETGISFTEFSYQLLQGYDFLHLYKEKNVRLQMGGSDQWGNMTSGTELIGRIAEGKAHALTCPLVTKADGTKFGKSESGNIWLDAKMTSPYKFYQFWINVADEDAHKLIRVFTLKTKEEIESLEAQHALEPHLRILQKAMAEEITVRVHGREQLDAALRASEILFGKDVTGTIESIDEPTLLSVFEGIPQIEISSEVLMSLQTVPDLIHALNIFPSKGEAKRMIQSGGVTLNKQKINGAFKVDFIHGKYLILQKGKKEHFLIKVV